MNMGSEIARFISKSNTFVWHYDNYPKYKTLNNKMLLAKGHGLLRITLLKYSLDCKKVLEY